jgi:hypothetical protein
MKYYTFLLIIIILLIIYLFYYIYQRSKNNAIQFIPCDYKHLILNKKQLKETSNLLLELYKFFDENNIDYFAIGGTLIGAVRNGGLLPFDDDIDIGILSDDVDKIINYSDDNYYFEEIFFGYKFKKRNSETFIDVFIFEYKNNQYQIIDDHWVEHSFKSYDEIFPLRTVQFSELQVKIPNKYKIYLDRSFPNWDTTIKVDCGHYSDECTYEKHNIPNEFNVEYDNSKYLCYSKFT